MQPTTCRVLVVEDSALAAEMVKVVLVGAGFPEPTVVDTGEGALAILDQRSFDMAVVDIELPDRDGVEVLATMRERAPGMCVVACTGHEATSEPVRRARPHVHAVVDKAQLPASGGLLADLCRSHPEETR